MYNHHQIANNIIIVKNLASKLSLSDKENIQAIIYLDRIGLLIDYSLKRDLASLLMNSIIMPRTRLITCTKKYDNQG